MYPAFLLASTIIPIVLSPCLIGTTKNDFIVGWPSGKSTQSGPDMGLLTICDFSSKKVSQS